MGTAPNILCRDCFTLRHGPLPVNGRCPRCGSPRQIGDSELTHLSLAHLDCDAFYASIEKRDNPDLTEKPVIVGGGRRGVVSAACYIARIHGVRSAMPMFKALKACPQAVVIKPNMKKYAAEGRRVRQLMRAITPLVEPLSIDEAFMDLAGTEELHGGPAAETLARLAQTVEREVGITLSIGLSFNKFLAKIASDLNKPRGFSVINRAGAVDFLRDQPVSLIWGAGRSLVAKLNQDGFHRIGDLALVSEAELIDRFGAIGQRLARFARAEDGRSVTPDSPVKSVSAETTFAADLSTTDALQPILWRLCEEVSDRLKQKAIAGRLVTLKLKTDDFKTLTRRRSLPAPTQLADVLFHVSETLLRAELDGRSFRLIGVGSSGLEDATHADPPDLADPGGGKRKRVEHAIDQIRARHGGDAILKGRGLGGTATRMSPSHRFGLGAASDHAEDNEGGDENR